MSRNASDARQAPLPVVDARESVATVHQRVADVPMRGLGGRWLFGLLAGLAGLTLLFFAVFWLLGRGIGIWGVNIPVAWGFAIANFVWWIGIGHAGTFISAFLLLMHQDWRASINRFAEAMTIFAVMCAGLFPLLHMGRPWLFYFLFPYPDTMGLWPQWRSPLVWDVFAVSTYFTVSLIFWYTGLVPDFATLRDRTERPSVKRFYGVLALGWRHSLRHWVRYEQCYLLLAGLATPLVISVHSVVSLDFAAAIVPGWHSTIFPPYFVAGAIFSGFAMVLTLGLPLRRYLHLEGFITGRHLDNMAKMLLVTGLIVAYSYASEAFMAWYSHDRYESYMQRNRILGPYGPIWWGTIACNVVAPQLLWWRRIRLSARALFWIALVIQLGMWLERVMIVITSLHRDFMPSAWGMYVPTQWDWYTLLGTIGFFTFAFLLFVRIFPVLSLSEARALILRGGGGMHGGGG